MEFIVFALLHWLFAWLLVKHVFNPLEKIAESEIEWTEEDERELFGDPEDTWDDWDIDYDTGEVSSYSRPTIRYPKNVDREYAGGSERFDYGGG